MPVCANCGQENPAIARFCLACATPLLERDSIAEVRKTVTIVFSDLVGSTAMGERLDPEAVREVMTQYLDGMKRVVERHGGVVEKYIGDALMAVFGLPQAHEDDGLRAVRAASEMQETLADMNGSLERTFGIVLASRTGVMTGEVVAGDASSGQRLATGDPVNSAARLEQAAGSGEILIGLSTYRLVKGLVKVIPVDPIVAKGKAEPIPAFRLLMASNEEPPAHPLDMPLVGRHDELATLQKLFEQAQAARSPHIAVVTGEAGIGKSRLIDEFADGVADTAHILRGRCAPYGEGITFRPLIDVIKAAARIDRHDSAPTASEKIRTVLDGGDMHSVSARLEPLMGISDRSFPLPETFWAAHVFVQALARTQPLVIIFEDLHWAEPTFIDLIAHLVNALRDAPILLLCSARLERSDDEFRWVERFGGDSMLPLEALDANDAERLLRELVSGLDIADGVRAMMTRSAQGNPLFISQLVATWVDEGFLRQEGQRLVVGRSLDSAAVPPSIAALVTTRIDGLEPVEREFLELGSVIGHVFSVESAAVLAGKSPADLSGLVLTLESKNFIRPSDDSTLEGSGVAFVHALVHDCVYEGILKRRRAELHERLARHMAGWAHPGSVQTQDVVGFHLERSYWLRAGLGPIDEQGQALGLEAGQYLAAAGRRAWAHGDIPAAVNLLDRAVALVRQRDPTEPGILADLARCLVAVGDLARAESVIADAIQAGGAYGDVPAQVDARLSRALAAMFANPEGSTVEAERTAEWGIRQCEAVDDPRGLALAWELLFHVRNFRGHLVLAGEATEHMIANAQRAGDRSLEELALSRLPSVLIYGPTPARAGIDRCRGILREGSTRVLRGHALRALGFLLALDGNLGKGRKVLREARSIFQDLGLIRDEAIVGFQAGPLEMLDEHWEAAERELRYSYEVFHQQHDTGLLSTIQGFLAHVLMAQGRANEAEVMIRNTEAASAADDVVSQVLWRTALARVWALRGEVEQAERMARSAVTMAAASENPRIHAEALRHLAEVLRSSNRVSEAADSMAGALRLYEAKGDLISSARVRRSLRELGAAPLRT